jgi:DNA repair protein RadC
MLPLEKDSNPYQHAKLDYHATVRELPSHERPRERLQRFGPQALSMAELLAIILRTGTKGDNALELANKLLAKYGVCWLLRTSVLKMSDLLLISACSLSSSMHR